MSNRYAIKTTAALVAGAVLISAATPAVAVHAASGSKVLAVGSTALQPLAQQAAEMYQEAHPKTTVTIQGGGSGTGLSQVGKAGVTIGNSDIFAEQKDGVDASKLKDHKVAVVGITPVVNKDVNVKNLTTKQIQNIFSGKVTNWKEVGGQDEKIVLINRAEGSGTRATFEQSIMGNAKTATAQEQDDNGAVQKIVGQTKGAISYLAFSYTKGTAAENLKTVKINNVAPKYKNVKNNKWKIWAYEHMYTASNVNSATKKFIKFMSSKAVKTKVVKKLGYYPVSKMTVKKDADGKVTTIK